MTRATVEIVYVDDRLTRLIDKLLHHEKEPLSGEIGEVRATSPQLGDKLRELGVHCGHQLDPHKFRVIVDTSYLQGETTIQGGQPVLRPYPQRKLPQEIRDLNPDDLLTIQHRKFRQDFNITIRHLVD